MKSNALLTAAVGLALFAGPALSASPALQEAIALAKQTHADKCAQRQLRGQILLAHQSHDQEQMDTLGPRLEAVNERLKPSESRLNALKLSLGKNSDEERALDAALQESGACD